MPRSPAAAPGLLDKQCASQHISDKQSLLSDFETQSLLAIRSFVFAFLHLKGQFFIKGPVQWWYSRMKASAAAARTELDLVRPQGRQPGVALAAVAGQAQQAVLAPPPAAKWQLSSGALPSSWQNCRYFKGMSPRVSSSVITFTPFQRRAMARQAAPLCSK